MEELELDEPRDDEVLVRLVATGICQTDAHVRNGRIPAPFPIVLGHEGAGVIERVGPAVTALRPGDRVVLSYLACGQCGPCFAAHPSYCVQGIAANFSGARLDGTRGMRRIGSDDRQVFAHFFGQSSFAYYALATERNAVKVDDDAPLELLGPLGCGFQTGAGAVLNSFAVPAGATIAILGVGAVGLAAVMASHVAGASTIIAVDVNPQRLALAEELGATHTIDVRYKDVTATIRDIASRGVGFALDTTGRADMINHAVAALAPMGQVGVVAGGAIDAVVPVARLAFGMSVRGIVQGDAVPQMFIPMLIGLFRSGRFPIDRLVRFYEFDEIETAFADAARGEVVKPVLRISMTGVQQMEEQNGK